MSSGQETKYGRIVDLVHSLSKRRNGDPVRMFWAIHWGLEEDSRHLLACDIFDKAYGGPFPETKLRRGWVSGEVSDERMKEAHNFICESIGKHPESAISAGMFLLTPSRENTRAFSVAKCSVDDGRVTWWDCVELALTHADRELGAE